MLIGKYLPKNVKMILLDIVHIIDPKKVAFYSCEVFVLSIDAATI